MSASKTRSTLAPSTRPARERARLWRYFSYSWLFDDADSGSALERSSARRRNQLQSKWLPKYLLRWTVAGTILAILEQLSERMSGNSLISAALAVAVIWCVLVCLVTAICWAFLHARRPR